MTLTVTVKGRAAHASNRRDGVCALTKLHTVQQVRDRTLPLQ